MGRNNCRHQDVLGASQLKDSSAEKDLGDLVGTKLLATKKANSVLGCIRPSIISRSREMIHSPLVRLCLLSCVQFWVPQYQRDPGKSPKVQRPPMEGL